MNLTRSSIGLFAFRATQRDLNSFVPTQLHWWPLLLLLTILAVPLQAQITNVVFQDDFEDGIIDTNKYKPDAPFFEGGKGTFQTAETGGVLQFTGTVTEQWWPGTTLRLVP